MNYVSQCVTLFVYLTVIPIASTKQTIPNIMSPGTPDPGFSVKGTPPGETGFSILNSCV